VQKSSRLRLEAAMLERSNLRASVWGLRKAQARHRHRLQPNLNPTARARALRLRSCRCVSVLFGSQGRFRSNRLPHPKTPTSQDFHIPRLPHPKTSTSQDFHIPRLPHPETSTSQDFHIPRLPHPETSTSRDSHIPRLPHPKPPGPIPHAQVAVHPLVASRHSGHLPPPRARRTGTTTLWHEASARIGRR
jgi:hypothetical protein